MRSVLICPLLALCAIARITAQEPGSLVNALKDKALVLDIVARIVEREDKEVWNSISSRVTIPGRSISLKLVGINVVVTAQFTPYKREDGRHVLVAQGQVWASSKEAGMQYQTTIQTIPIDLGERIYFFPLGPLTSTGDPRIEIQIELKSYRAEDEEAADIKKDSEDSEATSHADTERTEEGLPDEAQAKDIQTDEENDDSDISQDKPASLNAIAGDESDE